MPRHDRDKPEDQEDNFDGVTFDPEQRKRLLKMLKEYENAQDRSIWLWSTLGIWGKVLGGFLTATVAFKVLAGDWIAKLLR